MNKGHYFWIYQKTFDTLNYSILVKKLERYGIRGVTTYWLINYLSNRKIRCKFSMDQKTTDQTIMICQ